MRVMIDDMKKYTVLMLLVVYGCNPPLLGDDNVSPTATRTTQVSLPCSQFNSTTDWIYCESVVFEKVTGAGSIILDVSMRNQRGSNSVCLAELYNVTDQEPIPFSSVVSEIEYELHTVSTANLREVLTFDTDKIITIRFRNTVEGSTSYLSSNSKIITYY